MTARILYSDLDGTMVGPGGCFFRTADGGLTLAPAQALADLLAADVTLVLVSGRTRPQLLEACRIFGADGFVGELGAVVGWDGGRQWEVLRGAMPAYYSGTPFEAIQATGVVDELFALHRGRLEYHSPWHLGHEADVMLRGLVDEQKVDRWLAERGLEWLKLRDNGVLPARRPTTLDPSAIPAHIYHLMPDGLSKGAGVAADLRRRGLTCADAVAVGDSASDLSMAPFVRELWLTANGARAPHMRPLIAGRDNIHLAEAPVGLGWVEAVHAALATENPSPDRGSPGAGYSA